MTPEEAALRIHDALRDAGEGLIDSYVSENTMSVIFEDEVGEEFTFRYAVEEAES